MRPAHSRVCVCGRDCFGEVSELRPWAGPTRRSPGAVCPALPIEFWFSSARQLSLSAGASPRRAPEARACSPFQDDLVNRTFLLGTFRTFSLGSDTTHLYGTEIRDTEFIDEWPYFSNEPGAERVSLFDLEADPYQQRNLAGQPRHAEMEAELRRELTAWNDGTPWPAGAPPPLPVWMLGR